MSAELDAVIAARASDESIPLAQMLGWMQSRDIEVLGTVFHSITKPSIWSRIQPPASFAECQRFARVYFDRCLREDPRGDWCDSRYSAGHSLIHWIRDLPKHGAEGAESFRSWKEWLAELYRAADEDLRTAIVTATLEHLFEDPAMARGFSDWREDPILKQAYQEAMEWVEHGGSLGLGFEDGAEDNS